MDTVGLHTNIYSQSGTRLFASNGQWEPSPKQIAVSQSNILATTLIGP